MYTNEKEVNNYMHQSPKCVIAYLQGRASLYVYIQPGLSALQFRRGKVNYLDNIGILYGIIPMVLQDLPPQGKPSTIAIN